MLIYAGQRGVYLKVRCTDPTCPRSRKKIKIRLRKVDRNDNLPGSTISRGEWSVRHISELPIWDDQYIAQRFLTLQRTEWVHATFERNFGLGTKNKGFERRMLSDDDANQVYWAVAALIYNITLSLNLADGRGTITPLTSDGIENAVKNFWKKDAQVRRYKQKKADARARQAGGEAGTPNNAG